MATATFRFYEELNDFLPEHRRKRDFDAEFDGGRSVKEVVEGLGVPLSEIDLMLANGQSVGFNYVLQDGDRVSVYPVFETFNIQDLTRLRDLPLRKIRFIAAENLGGVVKRLRLMGLDVACDPTLSDRDLIEISNREKRIILTQRRELFENRVVTRAIFVGFGTDRGRIQKIIDYLGLEDHDKRSRT